MDRRDDLNAPLDPAVVAKVAAHYRHARAKHPHFADTLYFEEECMRFVEESSSFLNIWRTLTEPWDNKQDANSFLMCELAEVRDAYARGDRAAAVEECYDAIAVLLRMVDVLEGRQRLGSRKTNARRNDDRY